MKIYYYKAIFGLVAFLIMAIMDLKAGVEICKKAKFPETMTLKTCLEKVRSK